MYPLRTRGRFRRHRFFQAGNWLVFYKVVEGTIYIRGLWPAWRAFPELSFPFLLRWLPSNS
jgi:hypothetical protein